MKWVNISQNVSKFNYVKLIPFYLILGGSVCSGIYTYEPYVMIKTDTINEKAVISVIDNGIGIKEEDMNKIMQPFFTTKPTGKGTGLGLSLANDIVRAHNGIISVESQLNEGTIFTLELPI